MTEIQTRILSLLDKAEGFPGTANGQLTDEALVIAVGKPLHSDAMRRRAVHQSLSRLRRRGFIAERDAPDGVRWYELTELGRDYFRYVEGIKAGNVRA